MTCLQKEKKKWDTRCLFHPFHSSQTQKVTLTLMTFFCWILVAAIIPLAVLFFWGNSTCYGCRSCSGRCRRTLNTVDEVDDAQDEQQAYGMTFGRRILNEYHESFSIRTQKESVKSSTGHKQGRNVLSLENNTVFRWLPRMSPPSLRYSGRMFVSCLVLENVDQNETPWGGKEKRRGMKRMNGMRMHMCSELESVLGICDSHDTVYCRISTDAQFFHPKQSLDCSKERHPQQLQSEYKTSASQNSLSVLFRKTTQSLFLYLYRCMKHEEIIQYMNQNQKQTWDKMVVKWKKHFYFSRETCI